MKRTQISSSPVACEVSSERQGDCDWTYSQVAGAVCIAKPWRAIPFGLPATRACEALEYPDQGKDGAKEGRKDRDDMSQRGGYHDAQLLWRSSAA
jgi:hypothetical protein